MANEEARNAKAEAKAAKAKAKAIRPWYQKKRWWVIGGLVILIAAGSASGGGGSTDDQPSNNGTDNTPTTAAPASTTVGTGFGSQDATDDLVALDCGERDELGWIWPSVTVKNNSSKSSDYWVTVVAESSDGSTRYDDTMIFITALGPGQTMTEDGLPFMDDIPAGAKCRVSEFQRTAS